MERAAALALLEAHHTFPGPHPFHVIVRADDAAVAEVSAVLAAVVGLPDLDAHTVRVPSRQGTYVSLRLTLPCASAEMVLDVYATLQRLPPVVRYF